MKKTLFLTGLILSLLSIHAEAGDSLKVFRRTSIYAEIGGPGYIHLNGNAEHYFVNGKWVHLGIRAGYGIWGSWGGEGQEALATVTALAGRKHHFLELQAGSMLVIEEKREDVSGKETIHYEYTPYASIGYTFRVGHLLLKTSLNSRTLINAGLGVTF